MTIYYLLIGYLLLLPVVTPYLTRDRETQQKMILRLGMLAIFLLLALKKETVGIDIPGYQQQYLLSASVPWNDVSYVYFEPGYIQLMKLFAKAGLPFQVFAGAIYALCCHGFYRFIGKYSPNVTLSLLIFVCYQFLVFYTSGLRQALAMGICIHSFLVLTEDAGKGWLRCCTAALLVVAAALVHKSALLFFAVLFLVLWRPGKIRWILLPVILALSPWLRPHLLLWIERYIGPVTLNGGITLGGNFLFLTGMTLLCVFSGFQRRPGLTADQVEFLPLAANVLGGSVILQILFSGSPLLRSAMYLTLFLIPGVPCALKRLEPRLELLLTWLLGVFLVVLFFTQTLWVNQLKLCPYLFFWQ